MATDKPRRTFHSTEELFKFIEEELKKNFFLKENMKKKYIC